MLDVAAILPRVVMAMPSLTELYMAFVNPEGVLDAISAAAAARMWVPALRVLDISRDRELAMAGPMSSSLLPEAPLALASLPAALAALKGSLTDLRWKWLLALASDPLRSLQQVCVGGAACEGVRARDWRPAAWEGHPD